MTDSNTRANVQFYNRTGFALDSLFIGSVYIGHIGKDSATTYISYPYFRLYNGKPNEAIRATINNQLVNIPRHQFKGGCGTGFGSQDGAFRVDIIALQVNEETYLKLE